MQFLSTYWLYVWTLAPYNTIAVTSRNVQFSSFVWFYMMKYFCSAMILLTSTTPSLQLRRQTIRKMLLIQGLLYTPVQVISLSLNLLVLYICNLHQCMTLSALSHSRGHPVPGANRTLKPYDVESTIGNFLGKWKIFSMSVYLPRKVVLLSCHSEDDKWCILCTAKNPEIYMQIWSVPFYVRDNKRTSWKAHSPPLCLPFFSTTSTRFPGFTNNIS
jgi:hypothetical protein